MSGKRHEWNDTGGYPRWVEVGWDRASTVSNVYNRAEVDLELLRLSAENERLRKIEEAARAVRDKAMKLDCYLSLDSSPCGQKFREQQEALCQAVLAFDAALGEGK